MYSVPLAAIKFLSLVPLGVAKGRVSTPSARAAGIARTLIFASSTDWAAISRNRTLLRSPKKFRLPPKSIKDPVTMDPLAITVVSPDCTPSSTRNRSARPTSALMGTSSISAIRKGSPSLSVTGTSWAGAGDRITGASATTGAGVTGATGGGVATAVETGGAATGFVAGAG